MLQWDLVKMCHHVCPPSGGPLPVLTHGVSTLNAFEDCGSGGCHHGELRHGLERHAILLRYLLARCGVLSIGPRGPRLPAPTRHQNAMLAIEGANSEDMRTGRSRIRATGEEKAMHVGDCARDAEREKSGLEKRGGVTKVRPQMARARCTSRCAQTWTWRPPMLCLARTLQLPQG